jgi:hypothetical protein
MKGLSRKSIVAVVMVAVAAMIAVPASGQGVEAIMRARESLALTEAQIGQLDAIRREIVAERSAEQAEMAELRSQLSAGQIRQSEVMAAQEDRQAAAEGRVEARRARIDAVLTEEQRASVELLRNRGSCARPRTRIRPRTPYGARRRGPRLRPRRWRPRPARRGARRPDGQARRTRAPLTRTQRARSSPVRPSPGGARVS